MDSKEFENKLEQIKTFKEVPISVDEKIQKAFEKIEQNEKLEKEVKKQKSKFNFSRVLSLAASFVMAIFLAGNGVAYAKGEPNIYSWILDKIDIQIKYKEDGEYLLEYSKKDENNNEIWNYNTESTFESQYDLVDTLASTNDRIYINENGTIVALNKETGEIIWKSDACKETEGAFDSVYLDKNQNLYIYRGDVTVIDKDGEKKAEISVPSTDGVEFEYVGDEELLISGVFGYAIINSSNYSVEESLSLNSFDKEEHIVLEKKDGNDKVIWKYELKDITEYDCLISSDWKYYIENKIILLHELGIITALDLETGKVVWKNLDFEGLNFSNTIFDSENNMYSSINEGPDLCIIDKNGKTIKTIEHFDVEDKISSDETRTMYVVKFRNNEKELVMEYKNVSGEYMIVNLEDYSITYESIEE